jgi:hypothetical protein
MPCFFFFQLDRSGARDPMSHLLRLSGAKTVKDSERITSNSFVTRTVSAGAQNPTGNDRTTLTVTLQPGTRNSDAHAASADGRLDLVGAEAGAGSQAHGDPRNSSLSGVWRR